MIEHDTIQADIKRTDRKRTIQIKVANGRVEVLVPKRTSQAEIESVLQRKRAWIDKQLAEQAARPPVPKRQFVSGETVPYLGTPHTLEVLSARAQSGQIIEDRVIISSPRQSATSIRNALIKFYRAEAAALFDDKISHFAERVGAEPSRVDIKTYKRRWGSCNRRREITFNWKLIMAPEPIIDHVVVHELCHLHHFDHSPQFWQKVYAIIPDYKDRHHWLKQHGYSLEL